jgi:hypothetical protein
MLFHICLESIPPVLDCRNRAGPRGAFLTHNHYFEITSPPSIVASASHMGRSIESL